MTDSNVDVLVIGLGNTLRGDDAIGRIAAEQLQTCLDCRRVKVLNQVAPTPELAAELARVEFAIFLDASVDGPKNRITTRRILPSETNPADSHRFDVAGLLQLAQHIFGRYPDTYALAIRGESFEFADGQLSADAAGACTSLVQAALTLIAMYFERSSR